MNAGEEEGRNGSENIFLILQGHLGIRNGAILIGPTDEQRSNGTKHSLVPRYQPDTPRFKLISYKKISLNRSRQTVVQRPLHATCFTSCTAAHFSHTPLSV